MAANVSNERQFRVGDRVRFFFGVSTVTGLIIEDRGQIGFGGRRLFRVEFRFSSDEEPMHIELPAEQLEHLSE